MNTIKKLTKTLGIFMFAIITSELPIAVQASDWFVGAATDNKLYFIDRQSIVRNGSIVKVNALVVYKKSDDDVSAASLIDEYNCSQNSGRTISMILLYENGASKKVQINDEWRQYNSGSVGYSLNKQVCGY